MSALLTMLLTPVAMTDASGRAQPARDVAAYRSAIDAYRGGARNVESTLAWLQDAKGMGGGCPSICV